MHIRSIDFRVANKTDGDALAAQIIKEGNKVGIKSEIDAEQTTDVMLVMNLHLDDEQVGFFDDMRQAVALLDEIAEMLVPVDFGLAGATRH
jgi:hypothetical protein